MEQLKFLTTLETVIQNRINNPTDTSYTARLATGGRLNIVQKLGEEAIETVLAGAAEDDTRLTSEAADLLYHLIVLLNLRGLSLANVVAELEDRHKVKSTTPS